MLLRRPFKPNWAFFQVSTTTWTFICEGPRNSLVLSSSQELEMFSFPQNITFFFSIFNVCFLSGSHSLFSVEIEDGVFDIWLVWNYVCTHRYVICGTMYVHIDMYSGDCLLSLDLCTAGPDSKFYFNREGPLLIMIYK